MFSGPLKDVISTIAALVLVIVTAVQQALAAMNGSDINWTLVISAVVVAVIGWMTGKNNNATVKSVAQVEKQVDPDPAKQ